MQPDVTVLIAAYNAEATILRAVDSALAQTGVSVEVLVVDDQSRDGTLEMVRTLPDPRVRAIALERNCGPAGARNAGLAEARGRWIAVLDSDDAFHPRRLARMIACGNAQQAEVVVDNLEVIDEVTGRTKPMFEEPALMRLSPIQLEDFIRANIVFRSTFNLGYMKPVFRRDFIERHGLRYDEALRIGEDYIFLASALARGAKCVVEPTLGYVYHVRDGSISRVLELSHVQSMLMADAAFEATHELEPAVRRAQAERRRGLKRAKSFLLLVQHLKRRALMPAIAVALRDPVAVSYLRMPIGVRMRRLLAAPVPGRQ